MINDIQILPLRQISDNRGKVMHMLRRDAKWFEDFGEIYFSTIEAGAVKAWHIHKEMVLNYAVPIGNIKLVLFDNRENSRTKGEVQEIYLGPQDYNLVIIPPLIWSGFKGLGNITSLVANCASTPHDPDEIDRLPPENTTIPYNWEIDHKQ